MNDEDIKDDTEETMIPFAYDFIKGEVDFDSFRKKDSTLKTLNDQ